MAARRTSTTSYLSIGEVAAQTNVAPSALRFYEAEGLIDEPHRVGGKRRYADADIARIALIQMGQAAGFRLKDIKTLLKGVDGGTRKTAALQRLARDKLPDVEADIKRLQLLKRLLSAATECACPDLDACAREAKRAGLLQAPMVAPPRRL